MTIEFPLQGVCVYKDFIYITFFFVVLLRWIQDSYFLQYISRYQRQILPMLVLEVVDQVLYSN